MDNEFHLNIDLLIGAGNIATVTLAINGRCQKGSAH